MRTARSTARLVPALLVALVLAGCGGGSDPVDEVADAGTPTTASGESTSSAPSAEPSAAAGDCTADEEAGKDRLSGSAAVLWVEDSTVPESADDATAENTLTFQPDESLMPSTLSVDVNEVFAVSGGTVKGLRVVKIGCADGQTVPPGVKGGFKITVAGTYPIVDEAANGYAGAMVGTVTVG